MPWVAGNADTNASVILSTQLVFLLYPEIQVKAQAELDAVIGRAQLPNFDDRSRLPYIDTILLEALRWNPFAPTVMRYQIYADVYFGSTLLLHLRLLCPSMQVQ